MKKIFYWRFSRKIEGEFWIFYKRFPWEKNWMEEIFKGISLKNWSWIHTRASLARAAFKRDFLVKLKAISFFLWVKSEKSESESIFGPLNLFIFGYVKEGVLGNDNIGIKKCTTTFSWVLNLGQVGGRQFFFQNLTIGMIFSKMVSKVIFLKNYKGISM